MFQLIQILWSQGHDSKDHPFTMYRNKEASHQGSTEAVKSWMCLLITVDSSFLNLRISSVNPLALRAMFRTSTSRRLIKHQNARSQGGGSGHTKLSAGRGWHLQWPSSALAYRVSHGSPIEKTKRWIAPEPTHGPEQQHGGPIRSCTYTEGINSPNKFTPAVFLLVQDTFRNAKALGKDAAGIQAILTQIPNVEPCVRHLHLDFDAIQGQKQRKATNCWGWQGVTFILPGGSEMKTADVRGRYSRN